MTREEKNKNQQGKIRVTRDIISDFYNRNLSEVMTPETMKMGWGWDLVMNAISLKSYCLEGMMKNIEFQTIKNKLSNFKRGFMIKLLCENQINMSIGSITMNSAFPSE